jgi:hypothetical protein
VARRWGEGRGKSGKGGERPDSDLQEKDDGFFFFPHPRIQALHFQPLERFPKASFTQGDHSKSFRGASPFYHRKRLQPPLQDRDKEERWFDGHQIFGMEMRGERGGEREEE